MTHIKKNVKGRKKGVDMDICNWYYSTNFNGRCKMKKIVRWLGAFGKSNSLEDSLNWELSNTSGEYAAEVIKDVAWGSEIYHATIGLLVSRTAVIKQFNGDCWSVKKDDGSLKKTRNPRNANGKHVECWVKPSYKAIVVDGQITKHNWKTVKAMANKYSLPVLDGNFKKIYN